MPEKEDKAAEMIKSYRKRNQRVMPLVLGGLAIVLLVVGVLLLVIFFTQDGQIVLPSLRASDTPTPTATATPLPPTETPTITPSPTITQTPTPEGPTTYIVEIGDSLWTIAAAFEVDVELLIAYNNFEDINNVPVGTEVIIPPPDAELPDATPLPADLQTGDQIIYSVKSGDTLAGIAEQFNTTVEKIAEDNEIEDTNSIGIGTELLITVGPTPTPTQIPLPGTVTVSPEA